MRNRLNAISGDSVALNTTFFQAGQAKDPYAIREIRIYRQSVREDNLVTKIILPSPLSTDSVYPYPLIRTPAPIPPNQCPPAVTSGSDLPGAFTLSLDLPTEQYRTGIYYDVWHFIGSASDAGASIGSSGDATCPIDDEIWQKVCNKFFVVEGGWFADDSLSTIRIGFEPLDSRFQQPEKRILEVGMMPLPLYDFDYKKIMPLLPFLDAKITVETQNNEILVDGEPMTVGERAGSYRTCPFVLRWFFDTSRVLKGTYKYRVDVALPNGETRSSPYYNMAVR